MDVRPIGVRERLRQPALEPQCGEQRGQFDYDHGQREPPDQIGSVEPPGDEQERQTREPPQCEPAAIGASALGQAGDVRTEEARWGQGHVSKWRTWWST